MEKGDSARVKDHGKEPATRETGKWVVEREGCMTDWSEMTLLQVWGQSVESPGWSWACGVVSEREMDAFLVRAWHWG